MTMEAHRLQGLQGPQGSQEPQVPQIPQRLRGLSGYLDQNNLNTSVFDTVT